MRRWVIVGVLVILGLIGVGIILVSIQRKRLDADREACRFRFMQLGQFGEAYAKGTKGLGKDEVPAPDVPLIIPPGTVPNPALPPDRRLSWVCDVMLILDQKSQDTLALAQKIDRRAAWDAEPNREVSLTRLNLLVCPGALPDMPEGQPAPTQFVGLSGVGPDSATLSVAGNIPPRAGCFRYDAPTPLALIRENDGLSTTFLFAETANDLGPWIRGGFSTVRGLDVGEGAKPPLGRGGQFGGNYPGVVGFGRADGSAGFVRQDMNLAILRAHFTIAGGEGEGVPGE
jgi:hypothetical protein